jgi:Fe-S-cluster containining protein
MHRASPLDAIERLYAEVDSLSTILEKENASRLACKRGCNVCCIDGFTVYEVEAANIRRRCADVLSAGPHAEGACAFLDERGCCRIYPSRPYVCRTQGLPLRWLDEDAEGEVVEYRDICALNEHGEAVEQIAESKCWTIGPFEERLMRLQLAMSDGTVKRVALRSLFDNHVDEPDLELTVP